MVTGKTTAKRKVVDLRKATDPDDNIFICEHCDIRLIPYNDIKGERLTRGKLWQCGRCGQIKDTEMDNLQHPETLTSRGDTNQNVFLKQLRQPQGPKHKPYDPEPNDEANLKAQGFHIIKTRITSGDGKILRYD
jgi:transcription elongation factor Elf1